MSAFHKLAVVLILRRERDGKPEFLLQKRQNTGYADGRWDFAASGHVEAGESLSQAMARETEEELGVSVRPQELRLVTLVHRRKPDGKEAYLDAYFLADGAEGSPAVREPEKCAEIRWFSRENLPETLMEDRRKVLEGMEAGTVYQELGWGKEAENE